MAVQIPMDGVQQAIYAVGVALVGMGGLIGVVMRWMMSRVDSSQRMMERAIESFEKSTAAFSDFERNNSRTTTDLLSTQEEILDELRKLKGRQ